MKKKVRKKKNLMSSFILNKQDKKYKYNKKIKKKLLL